MRPLSNKKKKDPKKIERGKSKRHLAVLLEKAGLPFNVASLKSRIYKITVILTIILSGCLIFYFSVNESVSLLYLLFIMALLWTLGLASLLMVVWLIFYILIDFRVYQRKVGIEEVFPDFLQLTSANIRAGMAIDQALWHAIRPNFGVLAKEMEDVAKETMSGTSLEEALYRFASKYDSNLLKRSISLLIEGLNAGGEIGELLDRISTNIQESRIMQKEMSASVTTYAIFISFASILAAPFLLALSSQLLRIIEKIVSSIDVPKTSTAMIISFSEVAVKPSDFRIFAIVTLVITSLLSAAIVATIKKGNIRAGFKYIPVFMLSSVMIFLILNYLLGKALSGIF